MTKYIINKKPFFGTLEEFFKCAKREHEKDLDKAGLLDKEKRKKIEEIRQQRLEQILKQ